jgi:hypothetical protein
MFVRRTNLSDGPACMRCIGVFNPMCPGAPRCRVIHQLVKILGYPARLRPMILGLPAYARADASGFASTAFGTSFLSL